MFDKSSDQSERTRHGLRVETVCQAHNETTDTSVGGGGGNVRFLGWQGLNSLR